MDLRQLNYFATLAETLNFHRAAERLHISQPPLTVAIRKLEEELGAKLFERGSRGVALTTAGEAALEPARAALAHADQVRQAVHDGMRGERGRLSIGFVGSAIYSLLPRLIPIFRGRYPDVELALEESTSVDIIRRIRIRELDVGVVRLPLLEPAGLDTRVIEVDELVAAVPAASPLARFGQISLHALAEEPFILHTRISVLRMVAIMACHDAGFAPKVAQEAAQVPTIMSLVQSGLGVALVPSNAARHAPEGVKRLRLRSPVRIEAGLVLARDSVAALATNFQTIALANTDI